jgi:uncharacterized protein YecT (DUF1311 family)
MKYNRKFLVAILIGLFVLMAACGDSSDESSTVLDRKDDQSAQNTNNDSSNTEPSENTSDTEDPNSDSNNSGNNDITETEDTPKNEPQEGNSSTNQQAGLKEEYLEKLNDTKRETEEKRKNSKGEVTYALKSMEGNLFDIWDGLLNEIYGVLEEQLPPEEMDQLRKEQREWLEHRDHTAKEASLKYKGGTMEQLEYVTVVNNLTQERCFELVRGYMN